MTFRTNAQLVRIVCRLRGYNGKEIDKQLNKYITDAIYRKKWNRDIGVYEQIEILKSEKNTIALKALQEKLEIQRLKKLAERGGE